MHNRKDTNVLVHRMIETKFSDLTVKHTKLQLSLNLLFISTKE